MKNKWKFFKKLKKNIENILKSDKKTKKSEKDYINNLVKKEKKEHKNLSMLEISNKFGIPKELVEDILNEPEVSPILKKQKKIKKRRNHKIKFIDKPDIVTIKELLLKIGCFGILINFALFVIFDISFNFYSWIGWGIAFWLIKKEIVNIVRAMWIK